MAAGGGVGVVAPSASSAARALSRPPLAVVPARAATGVVEERMAARSSAAVAPGRAAASRATVPVTSGAAIDVPLYDS